jgi:hypothetical protein
LIINATLLQARPKSPQEAGGCEVKRLPKIIIMKNEHESTYALLVRSEEKSRDMLETAVYALFILSAVFAIWQFVQQPMPLPMNQTIWSQHPAPQRGTALGT